MAWAKSQLHLDIRRYRDAGWSVDKLADEFERPAPYIEAVIARGGGGLTALSPQELAVYIGLHAGKSRKVIATEVEIGAASIYAIMSAIKRKGFTFPNPPRDNSQRRLSEAQLAVFNLATAGMTKAEICRDCRLDQDRLRSILWQIADKGHDLPDLEEGDWSILELKETAAGIEVRPPAERLFAKAWAEHHGAACRYQDDARQAAISRLRDPVEMPAGTTNLRTLGGVGSYA